MTQPQVRPRRRPGHLSGPLVPQRQQRLRAVRFDEDAPSPTPWVGERTADIDPVPHPIANIASDGISLRLGVVVMTKCVVYARVSTAEQRDEGYSIPAQQKAVNEYCVRKGLQVVREFQEAESASRTGRTQFGKMLELLQADSSIKTVVVHKIDRLTRNMEDMAALDRLDVRVESVTEALPDSPNGMLVRDIFIAMARNYSANLRYEVIKGQREKVAQGGWLTLAPVGYLNDKAERTIVLDPEQAPLVRSAFELYAGGLVSLDDLAKTMHQRGLRMRKQKSVHKSVIHKMLRNPVYCGKVRYHGDTFAGSHTPIVSVELFERVQDVMDGNRIGRNNASQTRAYALRDFLTCGECGCKITAGTHKKKYVYYRCTHGKGSCAQGYVREEILIRQVEEMLAKIAIPDSIVRALLAEASLADKLADTQARQERKNITRNLDRMNERKSRLMDHLLDGIVDHESYAMKVRELDEEKATLELRQKELEVQASNTFLQVERLVELGAGAAFVFQSGSLEQQRDVVANVLCNLVLEGTDIVSYQYKRPFNVLEMDAKGAFLCAWSG